MSATLYLTCAALLPLLCALGLILFSRRLGRFAGALGTVVMFVSLALSAGGLIFFVSKWIDKPGIVQPYAFEARTFSWITVALSPASEAASRWAGVTAGVLVDSLTVALFPLITFIGAIIHLFVLGDPVLNTPQQAPRAFASMQFLIFTVLALLLSNSLFQMLIAWQLVGLATYFVINVHSQRRGPAAAAFRAFVFNRISDAAMILAIGLLVAHAPAFPNLSLVDAEGHSVLSDSIRSAVGLRASAFLVYPGGGWLGVHWLTWAGVLFVTSMLIRAAQFPFFWSDDSVEAPPPMSALLQSCTTLAAAVYVAARLFPILTLDARLVMAIVGCATLLLAALLACAAADFRRALAWTTVSQLGFVFLFMGTGAYTAALLQLFTHAFSKAILALALAAVLQAIPRAYLRADRPSGLWKRFPVTAFVSILALLSLAGAPFLAGAYSTNMGLATVYEYAAALRGTSPGTPGAASERFSREMLLYWVPVVTTYVTAFALGRWWWMLFIHPMTAPNPERAAARAVEKSTRPALQEPVRESALGTLALILLAGFTVGLLLDFLRIPDFFDRSLVASAAVFAVHARDAEVATTANLTALAPAALAVAWLLYFAGGGATVPGSLPARLLRLPGVNIVHGYLREGLFLQSFFDLFAAAVLLLVRAAGFIDRFILGAALRIFAFATEALAHLLAQVDVSLDRPAKTAALLMAPRFRRWIPVEPPASPVENKM